MVTVPESVNTIMRRNLLQLGETGFQTLISDIVTNMKPLVRTQSGATPWFRGVQRRYPSQSARPFIDATIDFDLRTAAPTKKGPKEQLLWLAAAYGAFAKKGGTNYQIQVGVHFDYDKCPELQSAKAIDMISEAWLACKPLVDLRS